MLPCYFSGCGVAVRTLLDHSEDADPEMGLISSDWHAERRVRDGGWGGALQWRIMLMHSVCMWQQGPRKHTGSLVASVRHTFGTGVMGSWVIEA
jgi:hypothetical protein